MSDEAVRLDHKDQIAKGKQNYGSDCYANEDEKLSNPGKVDEALWDKAKRASEKAFGKIKWPFVAYWYKEQGGKFS